MPVNQQLYQLSPDVLSVAIEGEQVLMHYASGKYFGIRGAMQILVDPLKQGITHEAMVAQLCSHYGVSEEVAETDLQTILPRLLDTGIVCRVEQD